MGLLSLSDSCSLFQYKTVLFSVGSKRGPTLLYEVQNNGLHKRERGA